MLPGPSERLPSATWASVIVRMRSRPVAEFMLATHRPVLSCHTVCLRPGGPSTAATVHFHRAATGNHWPMHRVGVLSVSVIIQCHDCMVAKTP